MTTTWDPQQYLRYAGERARPFVELLARIDSGPDGDGGAGLADGTGTVVDLGCGAGNLMAMLRSRWPHATIVGVDSSPEMIGRARADVQDAGTTFECADVRAWRPEQPVDVIVSNALFQWVPEQETVLRDLAGHVRPGGTVALQVPHNGEAPSHALMREVAARELFAQHTAGVLEIRGDGPELYLELFADLGWSVDAWETTYLHVLPGEDPVFEWVRGTGARPVLQALPDHLLAEFVDQYRAELRRAYPRRAFGTVLPFRRTFAVARKPSAQPDGDPLPP